MLVCFKMLSLIFAANPEMGPVCQKQVNFTYLITYAFIQSNIHFWEIRISQSKEPLEIKGIAQGPSAVLNLGFEPMTFQSQAQWPETPWATQPSNIQKGNGQTVIETLAPSLTVSLSVNKTNESSPAFSQSRQISA